MPRRMPLHWSQIMTLMAGDYVLAAKLRTRISQRPEQKYQALMDQS